MRTSGAILAHTVGTRDDKHFPLDKESLMTEADITNPTNN
jgi:hypothetical protein